MTMTRTFRKDLSSLHDVFAVLNLFVTEERIDPASAFAIDIAVEEFFTNMVKYGRGSLLDISLSLSREGNRVVVALTDSDVEPFDVTAHPEVLVDKPMSERRVGGLGIHLARTMVDSIDYRYADRKSTITFTKLLET
jgi:anti-sigma regulatory factor (Ser/Thr protein kinase)